MYESEPPKIKAGFFFVKEIKVKNHKKTSAAAGHLHLI